MNIHYTDRQGQQISVEMDRDKAIERMIWLWQDEAMTIQVNTTDSSDMRFNYRVEARAIKAALSQ